MLQLDEKRLRDAVCDVGGGWNKSCSAPSVAIVVTSQTGANKKSVKLRFQDTLLLDKL